jgi:16S rRNA processing protein RimM
MAESLHVAVGRVGRPHGLHGEVRVDSLGGLPRGLGGYRNLYLGQGAELTRVQVDGERPHGRFLLIKLAGIDSPDQARRWTHATLYVERDEMPALEQGEYYFVDLLGCRVEDEAGSDFGTVADVFASGAHDVMVVREGAREWMLPVLARWVLSIDVAGKQVVVRLPEGLRE